MEVPQEFRERYPHMTFHRQWALGADVLYQIGQCEAMVEAICEMPMQPEYRKERLRVSLNKGAQATTAIEGNTLTTDEVRKVAEGVELPKSKAYQAQEVANILEGMNTILTAVSDDDYSAVITPQLIRDVHKQVGKGLGDHFDSIPGRFRTDERVVGPYKCPRPADVDELVKLLCDWLPKEFGYPSGRQTFVQAVVQAIVTHVYIEWIHPFGDGNGRTGRLLEFYILLRANNPDIASHILSNHYNTTRVEYYRQLDRAHKDRDLTAFVRYAVQGYYDGLVETLVTAQESVTDIAWRYLVYSEFAKLQQTQAKQMKKDVVRRRREVVLSMLPGKTYSGTDVTVVTPEVAKMYGALSERTVVRDVLELQRMNLIVEESKGKWRINLGLLLPQFARRKSLSKHGLGVS
ncbi:MAG: Fic family protein [Acidobacteriota bacterium]|nr:Fic family protein [Acidobacteriota bacterium]